jgi:plasmid stability protein
VTDVRIRNVEEWILEYFRSRARSKGHSLEKELRELLREEARRPRLELGNELRQMRDELRKKYGAVSDSVAIICEDRDSRE